MKAVIIEDETAAVSSLRAVLAQNTVADIEVVAELESIEESVDWFRAYPHPDIIFMDIHLADGSAFRIFEQVEIGAPVVFTTAYDEYALQAFQVSSIDYLLKPVTVASLERALNKLRLFDTDERNAHIQRTNTVIQSRHTVKSLLIMLADKFYPLPVDDILFFYTANEKVTAYTADGRTHPVDRTLDTLGEQLEPATFFRANRQFIISRRAIRDIDLWFGSRIIRLHREEILYLEGYGDYVKIHRAEGKLLLSQVSLKRFEEYLDTRSFCRVHRSYIVSLAHISYIEHKRIRIGKELIPISDSYLPELMNRLSLLTC